MMIAPHRDIKEKPDKLVHQKWEENLLDSFEINGQD
jgi:hypothetical protein